MAAQPTPEATPNATPRRHRRALMRTPITVLEQGQIIQGLTKDLSEGGVGAAIPRALALGAIVRIQLDNPGLVLSAAVRYRDGFLHGLEFTIITSAQREALQALFNGRC